MTEYNVNELFETIQGEGQYTGTPSIFLRLQGCPVGCSWCDTKQTWDTLGQDKTDLNTILVKRIDGPSWTTLTAEGIINVFKQQNYAAKHVVITGGEPCMFDLTSLCELLHSQGYTTQIETSGTFEIIAPEQTWVTVSPKLNMKGGYAVLSSCMIRANEIKHPVARQTHVDELKTLLQASPISEGTLIYLQPISQKPAATKLAIETCIKNNWRLSVQVHKYIGIS
jgi:7-carboxy-7-deazaguanine synthase